MSDKNKAPKERPDRRPMPGFARGMLVFSVIILVFAIGLHIKNTIDWPLLMTFGVCGLVGAVLAAFGWDAMPALRRVVRVVLVVASVLLIGVGTFSVIYASSYNPDSDLLGNIGLYGLLVALFLQALIVFSLPLWVAAASFGAKIDRVLLCVHAWLNAGLTALFMFYAVPNGLLYMTEEWPVIQFVYTLFTVAFAILTFVPAISSDSKHSLTAPKL
ncbi:MAG: hypothetical protein IJC52_03795 [Clostridia bacterium]|nr:hypothetical protein [Clostridia bacterium]